MLKQTIQHPFFRPNGRLSSGSRRQNLKTELMEANPICSCCGQRLTSTGGLIHSAHLVRKRLSCPACVRQVRAVAKAEKPATDRTEKRPWKNRFGTPARLREAQQLMNFKPHCVACGRELTLAHDRENSAELVDHQLSCPSHVKMVSLLRHGRDVALAKMAAIEARANRRWYVAGDVYATLEAAESAAVKLADAIATTVEILVGIGGCTSTERCQIVRPARRGA